MMKYILPFIILLISVQFQLNVIYADTTLVSNIENVKEISDIDSTDLEIHSIFDYKLPLLDRIAEEESTWHWYPWKRITYKTQKDGELIEDEECEEQSSIDDFPEDLFTNEQRLRGAIILHFLGAIYFFTTLGVVINNYFIPSVQCICDDLKIPADVGAAVFMATATATPELFTNLISTFIADSDMGIGTVIGSLMFNILGVAAVSSLATNKPVRMDWWPITRDCIIFAVNVVVLIIFSWDGVVMWWEAMILLLMIIIYYAIMFQSRRIGIFMKRKFEDEYRCCNRNNYDFEKDESEIKKPKEQIPSVYKSVTSPTEIAPKNAKVEENEKKILEAQQRKLEAEANSDLKRMTLWKLPVNATKLKLFWWFYSWPIRFVLTFLLPNPKTWRRLYPLTFLLCIVAIGLIAYLIFWMLIIIGYTFSIPESVMGMTFLAVGGCTPELITGFIMARQGKGAVGVANSLGASTLAILLSLGLPWFIRGVYNLSYGYPYNPYVKLHSYGIEFTILSLLGVVGSLYLCLALSSFFLKKVTGIGLACFYAIFITFAVLVEIDVFFPSSGPCNGGVGIANSLGAATLTILLSLGLPWFASAILNNGNLSRPKVNLDGYGVEFTILSLLFVIFSLYTILSLSKFILKKITGFILTMSYLISVTFALLVELDILFPDKRTCT